MLLTVEQAALARATARVSNTVERKNSIPILQNLLLRADGEQLSVTGTDLDIEVQQRVSARVQRAGCVTVPAHTLNEIARNAPAGADIEINYQPETDPRVIVRFGRSRYQLPALPVEDFPTRGALDNPTSMFIDPADLRRMLDNVHFAQSTEETRWYLCGTYLERVADGGDQWLRVVATNGHQLVRDQIPFTDGAGMPGVTIPRKAVAEIRRLLADEKDMVTLEVSTSGVRVIMAAGHLDTKVVDGHFPEYTRVIPLTWRHEIEVDRLLLKAAIKRVDLIQATKSRPITLAVQDDTLTLTVRNQEAALAVEELEVRSGEAEFQIGFNARYLMDFIDQTDDDQLLLRITDRDTPTRLDPLPSSRTAPHVANVVMSLRA